MSWQVVLVIALAATQISASPRPKHPVAVYSENVISGQGRILSGWDATPGQFPYHANLRIMDHWGNAYGCGGSIVSRNWVISAAHCTVTFVLVQVRAGMVRVVDAQFVAESREWYNHPTWNPNVHPTVQPNDISIIKLPRPIVYSNLLRPIRIQSSSNAHRSYSGRRLVATGHGRTWTNGPAAEILQWVYLSGVDNQECFSVFGNLITANAVCAQFYNVTSQSTCQGDSGGPLVDFNDDGEPILIGVSSFVAGGEFFGCHSGLPAGFVRTGPFHPWFRMVTGEDMENIIESETEAPATEPPATEPPATDPPATDPPTTEPPATEPPATEPPATDPPATDPPTTEPPATEPPATEPPATEPPATEPPATELPATELPATEPPATEPPATEPPATEPPATEPPATEPPATEPPATEPPATEPPATEPPATEPPATEPPATEPPATEPSATEPPATEPPATEPPATEPPATDAPVTDGPQTDGPGAGGPGTEGPGPDTDGPTEAPETGGPGTDAPGLEPTPTQAPSVTTEPDTGVTSTIRPTTVKPEGDGEESSEDDNDGDDSSSSSEEDDEEDDDDVIKLLKKLLVKVKVNVQLNKFGKKIKHVHKHSKAITHHR